MINKQLSIQLFYQRSLVQYTIAFWKRQLWTTDIRIIVCAMNSFFIALLLSSLSLTFAKADQNAGAVKTHY